MKLAELGEFGLIGQIARKVSPDKTVRLGIGDDAAATEPTPGCLTLTTSDMLIEGVHFDLDWCTPASLGRKSLSVNLSDIAAMGGVPRWFLLSLAIPPTLPVEFLDAFIQGMLGLATEHNVTLIGGDTCSSRNGLAISVTLLGEQLPERVVSRSGARPGDLVFVTGTLGDSALGLEMLKKGERSGPAVEKHLDPTPRLREGMALAEAGLPIAMIDISDGLAADLGHILEMSGVGARLLLDEIPLSPFYRERVADYASDPFRLALGGGEDYELLFTAPPSAREEVFAICRSCGTPASVIGTITESAGLTIESATFPNYRLSEKGYNHFRND
ncbi:MAG: thiamine-phosphate kinase [Geobacter sp.]|nr:thiamine-phosphate kinase [Geobacter sp.]